MTVGWYIKKLCQERVNKRYFERTVSYAPGPIPREPRQAFKERRRVVNSQRMQNLDHSWGNLVWQHRQ